MPADRLTAPVSRETDVQPAVLTGFVARLHARPNVDDARGTPTIVILAELEGGLICQLIARADDSDALAEALARVGSAARANLVVTDRMPVVRDQPQG